MQHPDVTFILASHNRRDIVLDTLRRVRSCDAFCGSREIIVVDNGSTDGTPEVVRQGFGDVTLLRLERNLGSCAKQLGVERARGRYVVFLDDDSYPRAGAVERMIEHFESDTNLGAAGFRVHLPDGREECSAFPNVFVGCGVGLRTDALRSVGGLDLGFFMQAEEFDLSFRLVNAGWRVETFNDLHVDHLKTPRARLSGRTTYHDARNNMRIAQRYLTEPWWSIYRADWMRRYYWLACENGHRRAFARAMVRAWTEGRRERRCYAGCRLTPEAFEQLFRVGEIQSRMAAIACTGIASVVFADLGKNVHAFVRGAAKCGLSVLGIVDDRFAASRRHYRGIPILPTAEIEGLRPDAIVVSNTAPVHAAVTADRLSSMVPLPVHQWFHFRQGGCSRVSSCSSPDSDDTRGAEFAPGEVAVREVPARAMDA